MEPADPRDRLDERLEFIPAMEELSRTTRTLGAEWIVNSQVWKQADVAEILGVNPARINYLLRRVSERLNEMGRLKPLPARQQLDARRSTQAIRDIVDAVRGSEGSR